jgi:hypothetical protein
MPVKASLADSAGCNHVWNSKCEDIVNNAIIKYYNVYSDELDSLAKKTAEGTYIECRMIDKYMNNNPRDFIGTIIRNIIETRTGSNVSSLNISSTSKHDQDDFENLVGRATSNVPTTTVTSDTDVDQDVTVVHFNPDYNDPSESTNDETFKHLNSMFWRSQNDTRIETIERRKSTPSQTIDDMRKRIQILIKRDFKLSEDAERIAGDPAVIAEAMRVAVEEAKLAAEKKAKLEADEAERVIVEEAKRVAVVEAKLVVVEAKRAAIIAKRAAAAEAKRVAVEEKKSITVEDNSVVVEEVKKQNPSENIINISSSKIVPDGIDIVISTKNSADGSIPTGSVKSIYMPIDHNYGLTTDIALLFFSELFALSKMKNVYVYATPSVVPYIGTIIDAVGYPTNWDISNSHMDDDLKNQIDSIVEALTSSMGLEQTSPK